MKRLLISALGGSLFPYLHDKLKNDFDLYYLDNNVNIKKLYPDYNFFLAPAVQDSGYESFVKSIIKNCEINFYIPLIDEEIELALLKIESFNKTIIIAPNIEFVRLCLNKLKLMQFLEKNKISIINSTSGKQFNNQIEFPIFVKPIKGRGSRGARSITSIEQLDAYYELEGYEPNDVLIQPLIKGTEYTVGVLTNNLNNIISISSKRIISKKGITQIAITENKSHIDEVVFKVVKKMKPCGPINIQLMVDEFGEVKIFEINPRFSTTSILEIEGGIDLISMFIEYYNKEYLEEPLRPLENITIHRRWENVFYND